MGHHGIQRATLTVVHDPRALCSAIPNVNSHARSGATNDVLLIGSRNRSIATTTGSYGIAHAEGATPELNAREAYSQFEAD
ncbi:Hypothetical predicted protein [Olea europaea subsp. europaea]|uniref:Uncharacterized protein n=1 Tax=Olea europaea subsp. europaea TaxID=158383 RepID=A0A8S0TKN9_OLEEU|nr:Hypothetical predicted protein [Olea europaea subsp. europaea]